MDNVPTTRLLIGLLAGEWQTALGITDHPLNPEASALSRIRWQNWDVMRSSPPLPSPAIPTQTCLHKREPMINGSLLETSIKRGGAHK